RPIEAAIRPTTRTNAAVRPGAWASTTFSDASELIGLPTPVRVRSAASEPDCCGSPPCRWSRRGAAAFTTPRRAWLAGGPAPPVPNRTFRGAGTFRGTGTGNALLTNIAYDVAVSPRRTYGGTAVKFAVGYKLNGKTGHAIVEAEDALIAALKVKTQRPSAGITY